MWEFSYKIPNTITSQNFLIVILSANPSDYKLVIGFISELFTRYLSKMDEMTTYSGYDSLVKSIGTLLDAARSYWNIGKYIVEFEQDGAHRAEYGSNLLNRLSTDLTHRYGKGFSRSNILYMRKFYVCFPKSETLSHVLSWVRRCLTF